MSLVVVNKNYKTFTARRTNWHTGFWLKDSPKRWVAPAVSHCRHRVSEWKHQSRRGNALKPKGNILTISVLLIAVSCAAGVFYGLKPTSSPSDALRWMHTNVQGVETIGAGDSF